MGVRNKAVRVAFRKGYRVSDCGTEVCYKGRTRKLQVKEVNGKQYHRFSVRVDNKTTNILVHKLMAYQKYRGQAFKDGIVIRHKDDNSLNNSKKNILLGTQSQNMKDRWRNANN
ncbi:MAG: HNH endonuclease [Sphaerochaetaceae bacterium]|nr:HNH endonuclease [Sphaerochaetaceae bacterium]